ncbi:MAG: pyruvate kinase [Clostridia bacterium]|nr:pyruvate kinase [Clostridia bacterium]
MRKTKIVCTLGPTTDDYKTLAKLCSSGMNVARFNFSHGDYEQQGKRIELFKAVREELNLYIPMMLDTKGPEIRIGTFKDKKINLVNGKKFILSHSECEGTEEKVFVNYPFLANDVQVGTTILINDGLIELEVLETPDKDVKCKVIHGGPLTDRKSVNIPGLKLNLPLLTKKDEEDIIFGIQNGFDIIAASFVRKAEDILAIKEILNTHNASHIKIIAKIENHEGVENFDQILDVADGIMVARGDLGVEIPIEQVPLLQKEFVQKCNRKGKMVIIATQMLESMIANPRPTRAEVSDIANAIFEGTSAIMLSGETASGNFPIECVKTMHTIAESVENNANYWERFSHRDYSYLIDSRPNLIVGHALCEVAMQVKASAIFSLSSHGNTPLALASFQPECPIYAITHDIHTASQLNLTWGVTPILVNYSASPEEMIAQGVEKAKEYGYVHVGDTVVIGGSDTHDKANMLGFQSNKTLGGIYVI